MSRRLELFLECVRDDVFHILQLALEVLQFAVVVRDDVLVVHVLRLELLTFALNGLKLLAQFLGEILKLLTIGDVLAQLIAKLLAFLLLQFLAFIHFELLLAELPELGLLPLVLGVLHLIHVFDRVILVTEVLLLFLGGDTLFVGSVEIALKAV